MSSLSEKTGHVSVLVVDDDPDIRLTLAEILEDEGYSVATAGNGIEALAALQEVRPRLILLDLSMPRMDGTEFRRRQLSDPAIAAIPTVVITAAGQVRDRLAPLGISETLIKPLNMDRLLALVGRYCTPARAEG